MSKSTRHYRAFISYRHRDNQEQNRRWAQWLHDALEGYRVPRDLVLARRKDDPDFPESLYPIFRDEKELRPGGILVELIADALARSDALVVICSPRSAQSPWVQREIIEFKKRGMAERIIVVVIDGEPGAKADWELSGRGDPRRECLPLALRFGEPGVAAAANGRWPIDWRKPFRESLRIDLRAPEAGGEGFTNAAAYRDALRRADSLLEEPARRTRKELRSAEDEYARRLHNAILKIIAGILRVDLGELTRRDLAARSKRLQRVLWLTVAVLISVSILGGLAWWQSWRRQQLLIQASNADLAQALQSFRPSQWRDRLAYLERALRYWPKNDDAAAALWVELRHGESSYALCPRWIEREKDETIREVAWSRDGQYVATANSDDTAVCRQARDGKEVGRSGRFPLGPGELHFDSSGLTLRGTRGLNHWIIMPVPMLSPAKEYSGPRLKGQPFSPDGRWVVMGRANGGVEIVATDNPNEVKMIGAAGDRWTMAAWNARSDRVALGREGGMFSLFAIERTDAPLFPAQETTTFDGISLNARGDHACIEREQRNGGTTFQVWRLDPSTGPLREQVAGTNARWMPDGDRLLIMRGNDHALFFEVTQDRPDVGPSTTVDGGERAELSADGSALATYGEKGVRIFDLPSLQRRNAETHFTHGNDVYALASAGNAIAIATTARWISVWDFRPSFPIWKPKSQGIAGSRGSTSPDRRWIAANHSQGGLTIRSRAKPDIVLLRLKLTDRIDGGSWIRGGQAFSVSSADRHRFFDLEWNLPQGIEEPVITLIRAIGGNSFDEQGKLKDNEPDFERCRLWKTLSSKTVKDEKWKRLIEWWLEGRPSL